MYEHYLFPTFIAVDLLIKNVFWSIRTLMPLRPYMVIGKEWKFPKWLTKMLLKKNKNKQKTAEWS